MKKPVLAVLILLAGGLLARGETLTFLGGGIWDATSPNWRNESGETVAWTDGARARFTAAATLTVSGERTVSGIDLGADVTVSGDAIGFAEAATVIYQNNATLRFENEVNAGSGITFSNRVQSDVIYKSELEGNLGEEDTLLFRNLKLSDVDTIVATLHGQFGGANEEYTISSSQPNKDTGGRGGDYGCFFFEKNAEELTCQFQCVIYNGACLNAIKVRLHQVGNDIWGQRVWKKSVYARSAELFGKDLEAEGVGDGYDEWLFGLELRAMDTIPTRGRTEFVGEYNANGVETVVNFGTLSFEGERALNCNLRARNGGTVVFAANSQVTVPNGNKCQLYGGPFYIYGTMDVGKGDSSGNYHFFNEARDGVYVGNGGHLICRKVWPPYGYDNCYLIVLAGGLLETVEESAIGCNYNWVTVAGGRWYQAYDYRERKSEGPVALKNVTLSNGGIIDGFIGTMGHDYFNHEFTVAVTGNTACVINLDAIRLGSANTAVNAQKKLQSIFKVDDVTGDSASDLTVSSIFEEAVGMTVVDGCEANFFFRKEGEGTLELTGVGSSAPHCQFQLAAGTVKFGKGASAEFGICSLTGDAALEVEDDAGVAFADSSAVSWTEGKTLTLKSRIGKKSFRFGTDDKGLTAAQLAAIRYDESVTTKKTAFTLDASGYLRDGLSGGFCIRIR